MIPQCNEPHTQATSKWSNQGHWVHTVFDCPCCDGMHRHKGGDDPEYPDTGRRYVPPCCKGAGYIVVEVTQ